MIKKCIINKINQISSSSNKFIEKKINDEGLMISQNHVTLFYILPQDGSSLLFNEISNLWGISKSSLSDIVSKYEGQGLIKKCICSEDKRSVYIGLTSKGLLLKQQLEKIEVEFLELLLKDFDENEKINFEVNINKALKNIEKA